MYFPPTKSTIESYKQIRRRICVCNNYPHSWRNCSNLCKYHTTKLPIRALKQRQSYTFNTCLKSSLNKLFQFAFALNFSTTQLLLKNTANAAQIQSNNNSNMSSLRTNPQTPPTSAPNRVTFKSTPNSAGNSNRSSNDEQVSPILDLSKEEVFEKNLTQLFTNGFLTVLTIKVQSWRSWETVFYRTMLRGAKKLTPTSTHIGEIYTSGPGVSALMNPWQYHIQNKMQYLSPSTWLVQAVGVWLPWANMPFGLTCIGRFLNKALHWDW